MKSNFNKVFQKDTGNKLETITNTRELTVAKTSIRTPYFLHPHCVDGVLN